MKLKISDFISKGHRNEKMSGRKNRGCRIDLFESASPVYEYLVSTFGWDYGMLCR